MHMRNEIQSVSIYDGQEPTRALQLQVPQTLQHETALQGLAKRYNSRPAVGWR